MNGLATGAAVAATLAAVAWLAGTDPKRRRAFRLPRFEGRRRPRLAAAATLLPGALLLLAGDVVGFVIWLGGCTVAGWAIAAVPPPRVAAALKRLADTAPALALARLGRWAASRLPEPKRTVPDAAARIAALERRVARLEVAMAEAGAVAHPREPALARLADYQAAKVLHAGDA